MNTCTGNMISSLAFMLAAIASVAPAAAEKPTLVRDVDRPSVNPIAVQCEAAGRGEITTSCHLFTVPPNMVLVVDMVSFFAATADVVLPLMLDINAQPDGAIMRFPATAAHVAAGWLACTSNIRRARS